MMEASLEPFHDSLKAKVVQYRSRNSEAMTVVSLYGSLQCYKVVMTSLTEGR